MRMEYICIMKECRRCLREQNLQIADDLQIYIRNSADRNRPECVEEATHLRSICRLCEAGDGETLLAHLLPKVVVRNVA